jgi:CxxC-x17-CxxC domain-containing protein
MSYQDRTLTCADCGQPFTYSADDQAYHASRGFTNEPKRCPDCRAARRSDSGGGYASTGGYGGGARQMYEVTCSNCGRPAQVPFQPRGDRPVYCSDCYSRSGSGGGSSRGGGGRRGGSGQGGYGRGGRY